MTWAWLEKGFELVSGQHNPLLTQLITNGKLRVRSADGQPDSIDTRSISLVGAALSRRSSLLVVFPDLNTRRPAFLFAYALLSYWDRLRALAISRMRPILYCGVQPGIRDQLSRVAITGLSPSLGNVFEQTHLARGATAPADSNLLQRNESNLPHVVTAFSPAAPATLISNVHPAWIAVDLADAPAAEWLLELLTGASNNSIPVVAWGTNPLSDALAQFASYGHVVKWPMSRSFDRCPVFGPGETCETLFHPYIETHIHPVVLKGKQLNQHNSLLQQAADCLRQTANAPSGLLMQSAIQVH